MPFTRKINRRKIVNNSEYQVKAIGENKFYITGLIIHGTRKQKA